MDAQGGQHTWFKYAELHHRMSLIRARELVDPSYYPEPEDRVVCLFLCPLTSSNQIHVGQRLLQSHYSLTSHLPVRTGPVI